MRKVWIEVALNGAWSRKLQPRIPETVEAIVADGIACARASAATARHADRQCRLVEEAVRLVRENGGEPATAADVRAALK